MDTRPTADRLRETLFNVLTQGAQDRVDGANFLDLFAGSGAVGIEAISRGAANVTFVEQAPTALTVLRENLGTLGVKSGFSIEKRSVERFLRSVIEKKQEQNGVFSVVFLDPPYDAADVYSTTLDLLGGSCAELLTEGAWIVAEHRRKVQLANQYGILSRWRIKEQGDAGLSFYKVDSGDEKGELPHA